MVKVTLEVPEDVAELLKEMEAKLKTPPKVKMSAMWKKHLADADLDALVAYLKSLK